MKEKGAGNPNNSREAAAKNPYFSLIEVIIKFNTYFQTELDILHQVKRESNFASQPAVRSA